MPIPLIAAGIIAVGAATGCGGVALGGKGAHDMKKARERIKAADNRQVENAAIAFVIEQEALQGREAGDSRGRGAAGDLVSGERVIEVKAYGASARGQDLWLEVRQVEEARHNPEFWLYVVENVRQGNPRLFTLLRIGGENLQTLLGRAVERRYYTVPSLSRDDAWTRERI